MLVLLAALFIQKNVGSHDVGPEAKDRGNGRELVVAETQYVFGGFKEGFIIEDGAIAPLWRNHFINWDQRALSEICFAWFGIGIGSSRAGCLAIEIGSIVIAVALDDLCCQPGE